MVRWVIGIFLVTSVLAGLAYQVWQDRRVREFFAPATRSHERPLTPFPGDLGPAEVPPEPELKSPGTRSADDPDSRSGEEPATGRAQEDSLSNVDLARVVMGILRAKGLGPGINLSVSDDVLSVSGEVGSEKQKQEIIHVLENARGHRRLDAGALSVRSAR